MFEKKSLSFLKRVAHWWPSSSAVQTMWGRLVPAGRSWLSILAGMVTTHGITAVSLSLLAQRVTPSEFGQYMACLGLLNFFEALPSYGLDNWLLAQGSGSAEYVGPLWRSALRLRGILLIIWLGAMFLLGLFLPRDTYPFELFVLTAIWLLCDSLAFPSFSALRLINQHYLVAIIQAGTAVGVLAALWFLPTSPHYLLLFAGARAFVEFIGTVIVLQYTRQKFPATNQMPLKQLLTAAHPFMVAEVAAFVYTRIDLAFLSLFKSKIDVGFFGPSINILIMTFIFPATLYYFTVPLLAQSYHAKKYTSFYKRGVLQLVFQMLIGLSLMLGLLGTGIWLVSIAFGRPYYLSGVILQWLSPIIFFKSINFGLGAWLTSSNNQKLRTNIVLFMAIITIIVTPVSIFFYGIPGVIIADILTEVGLTCGYFWAVRSFVTTHLRRVR